MPEHCFHNRVGIPAVAFHTSLPSIENGFSEQTKCYLQSHLRNVSLRQPTGQQGCWSHLGVESHASQIYKCPMVILYSFTPQNWRNQHSCLIEKVLREPEVVLAFLPFSQGVQIECFPFILSVEVGRGILPKQYCRSRETSVLLPAT